MKITTIFTYLKSAEILRKAIISNCNRDLVNCISECVLNVINGNIALTRCERHKISKLKLALPKLVDRQVPLPGKKGLIVQSGGFLLPLLAVVLSTQSFLIAAK